MEKKKSNKTRSFPFLCTPYGAGEFMVSKVMMCGCDHSNVKVKQWFPLGRDTIIISRFFLYFNKSAYIQYEEAIYMVTPVIKTQNLGKNCKTYLVQIHTQPLLYPWQTLSYLLSPHWKEPYFSAHLSRTYEGEMTAMDAL